MDAELKKEILSQLQIDEVLYNDLLKDFAEELKDNISNLRQAFLSGDEVLVRKILHSLKGTSENLRVKKIIEIVDKLRELTGQKDVAKIVDEKIGNLLFYANNIDSAF